MEEIPRGGAETAEVREEQTKTFHTKPLSAAEAGDHRIVFLPLFLCVLCASA
jgi:hypothetical protein